MRRLIFFLIILPVIWSSCRKESSDKIDELNATCIKSESNSEIVNIKLKSGKTSSSPIDCYVMGSTIWNAGTSEFGYVDCNSNFILINPQTGEKIIKFQLPGLLSQVVIDTAENALIGQYNQNNLNYIVKVDLADGEIKAKNAIDLNEGVFGCTYFYDSVAKEYILLKADSSLIFINPDNGSTLRSVKINSAINNALYDSENKRIIGLSYSSATNQNYIETLNIKTGELISRVAIKENHNYYACVSDYDPESNVYILITSDNKLLFIDVETGKINDSFSAGFEIKEFKFWRNK